MKNHSLVSALKQQTWSESENAETGRTNLGKGHFLSTTTSSLYSWEIWIAHTLSPFCSNFPLLPYKNHGLHWDLLRWVFEEWEKFPIFLRCLLSNKLLPALVSSIWFLLWQAVEFPDFQLQILFIFIALRCVLQAPPTPAFFFYRWWNHWIRSQKFTKDPCSVEELLWLITSYINTTLFQLAISFLKLEI